MCCITALQNKCVQCNKHGKKGKNDKGDMKPTHFYSLFYPSKRFLKMSSGLLYNIWRALPEGQLYLRKWLYCPKSCLKGITKTASFIRVHFQLCSVAYPGYKALATSMKRQNNLLTAQAF